MNEQRWLALAAIAVGCILLVRATFLLIGAWHLLEATTNENVAQFAPMTKLIGALGVANLALGALTAISGIALWRRTAWANVLWLWTTSALLVGMFVLVVGTKIPWTDYFPEALLIVWSIVYLAKRRVRGTGAL